MTAAEKRIKVRLEQIKERAATENSAQTTKGGTTGFELAEEAAGLGLQLLEGAK